MDAEGSEKNFYRDPLIAMAFFAVLFFIILVVILAIWCKKRRQTEVKTVVIQPKKRPISTKAVRQVNGGKDHTNGSVDVEAGGITTDEVELSDDQDDSNKEPTSQERAENSATTSDEQTIEQVPETKNDSEQKTDADSDKGEVNPSFQKDDEEEDAPVS